MNRTSSNPKKHSKKERKILDRQFVDKPKNFKKTLGGLLRYLKPYKLRLISVLCMAILSTIFSVLSPIVLGQATTIVFDGLNKKAEIADQIARGILPPDTPIPPIDFGAIGTIAFILIALYLISAGFSFLQQILMVGVAQKTVYTMRKDVDDKLARLPLKFFDSKTHGEILSRVANDVDTVAQTLQQSLNQIVTSVVSIVGVSVMMLVISPVMTLICLVTAPVCLLITTVIVKKSQRYFTGQQRVLGNLNGHVEEIYAGHKEVKAYGYEQESLDILDDVNQDLYQYSWKAQFASGVISPLMTFINNLGYVFVAVMGGIRVATGQMNIGDVQAFIQYSQQFTQPITDAANISTIIQSTVAAAERVFEILEEEEVSPDTGNPRKLTNPTGHVTFKDVSFSYVLEKPLIQNLNLEIKSGQKVAIVGPTGAGKTTLVNLLMRFYEIDGGQVFIDDVDIHDMTRAGLRSVFGMVLQDTWLFHGSIKDNIAYSRDDATDDEIIKAAKAARIDHYIRTLPDGYDTVLNEEASNISQGQKQLLTIARVILAEPSVLILDEATSSVDTRTEIKIQKAMKTLMKGRTSFVIAHRLSTIKDSDIILVMKKGNIIETGNHEQLLAQEGFYFELYNSQFAGGNAQEAGQPVV